MSLIYITGISGVGKTTLAHELKKRGHEAYSADEEGFNSWYSRETGEEVKDWYGKNIHAPDWEEKNTWKTSRAKVAALAKQATNKPVFLSGISGNNDEIFDLFGKIICLDVDEVTLRKRLAERTTNNYGKAPHELEHILGGLKSYPESCRKAGGTVINSAQPIDKVIQEILDRV